MVSLGIGLLITNILCGITNNSSDKKNLFISLLLSSIIVLNLSGPFSFIGNGLLFGIIFACLKNGYDRTRK
jgi:hypothetical protein